jgi:hypothetical protein
VINQSVGTRTRFGRELWRAHGLWAKPGPETSRKPVEQIGSVQKRRQDDFRWLAMEWLKRQST